MKKFILFLIVGVFLINFVWAAETFTPIFCNDYEFTCCGGKVESTQSYSVSDESAWTCPIYAYKCIILGVNKPDTVEWAVGSSNCHLESYWYGAHAWQCDDEAKHQYEMIPNSQVYVRSKTWDVVGDTNALVEIKIIRPQLGFCGRSGGGGEETTCGVEVSGADGCKFSPINNVVYTSTSSLTGKTQTSSYTVSMQQCVLAFQSGDRHICGYKEESCSLDNDCGGHTYGNKECNGRILQNYGCRDYGTPIDEKDRGPFDSGWGSDKQKPSQSGNADFGKRCEIINAENVECCGDTDCGTNYFCDKSTFTCKENVECNKDYDCGVSVQCDQYTLTLKKPRCNNGKCGFDESKVECCSNTNCNGGYCDEYKCQSSSSNANVLKKDMQGITGAAIGDNGSKSKWIILIVVVLVIAGGLGFYFFNKNKSHPSSPIESGKKCASCNSINDEGMKFCTNCGKKL